MPTPTQKTAMTILRDRIELRLANSQYHVVTNELMVLRNLIDTELLEIEKQNIINAVDGFPLCNRDLNGEEYYLKTFGN